MPTSAFDETTRDDSVADAAARELSAGTVGDRVQTTRALVIVVADDHEDSDGLGALVGELLAEADFHVDAKVVVSGDEVEIRADDPRSLSIAKRPDIEEMLRALRRFRGRMPKDFKFNREELYERD